MWKVEQRILNEGRVHHFQIHQSDEILSYRNTLRLWADDSGFRSFYSELLSRCSFSAFRWETPAVTLQLADRQFEFVLLKNDGLDRTADRQAFNEYFTTDDVVAFPNLRRDATLVVPCPVADSQCYGHIAAFVRNAPDHQIHSLWQAVALAMQKRLSDRAVWLSTAGMGVPWLHVRLDDRPKYYGYAQYR